MSTTVPPRSAATIRIDGLSIYAHHGIVTEERSLGQRFEFDIEVELSDCVGCRTDDAGDVVPFEAIVGVVVEVATNFRFQLMEALAEAVSLEILAEFPVERVRIGVWKLAPTIPHPVSRAGVVVERTREHLQGDG